MQQQLSQLTMQIPDDIARLAHEQQLGAPQADSMITRLRRGWRLAQFALALSIIIIVLFTTILFLSIFSLNIQLQLMLLPPWIITCFASFIPSILAVGFTHRSCALYTCDRGLILRRSIAQFHVIRWDEIEAIWSTSMGRLSTIRCHDGSTLTFQLSGTRKNLDNLSKTLEEQFTRRRLPFQFADYQAGRTLHFGPLSIDRHGVTAHDKMLPWEQVADISLVKGRRLIIRKTGERPEIWLSLPAFKIPNLSILLALFQRIRGQVGQEAGMQTLEDYGRTTTIVLTRREVDPLPEGLAVLAEEHGLGERRLDQKLGRSRLTSWAQIISSVVPAAIMIATAIGFGYHHPSFALTWDALFFTVEISIFGLLLIPIISRIAMDVIRQFQQLHTHIYTFEHGIVLKRGQLLPVIWRWEEVETVWRVLPSTQGNENQRSLLPQSVYAHTIQLRGGAEYTLTKHTIHQETLGKLIQEQIVPLQLPAAIEAYRAGQTLSFGQVQVNAQGIAVGTRLLPWSQVRSVSLQRNQLVVYDITQRKPWGKLPEKRVPNLFLLFALTDYVRDVAGQE